MRKIKAILAMCLAFLIAFSAVGVFAEETTAHNVLTGQFANPGHMPHQLQAVVPVQRCPGGIGRRGDIQTRIVDIV